MCLLREIACFRDTRDENAALLVPVPGSAVATLVPRRCLRSGAARVALVIGNATHPDASTPLSTRAGTPARSPTNSVEANFDVDLKGDLGKEEMQRAIDAFIGKIRSGSAALFYFNGYGIQAGRQTFLVPINAHSGRKPMSGSMASTSMPVLAATTGRTLRKHRDSRCRQAKSVRAPVPDPRPRDLQCSMLPTVCSPYPRPRRAE